MRIPVALALSAALTLSACGGEDEAEEYQKTSADQVQKDAQQAMGDLESVHVAGTISAQGQAIDLDMALAKDGSCEGTMEIDKVGAFEVVRVDDKGFVKAEQSFWASSLGENGKAAARKIGDRWVAATGGVEQLLSFCSFEGFIDGLAKGEDGSWEEVTGTSEVDGESAVTVTFTGADGTEGTAHVAAGEPHRVLRYELGDQGEMSFAHFDEPVEPEAPAADDVVDLAKLA